MTLFAVGQPEIPQSRCLGARLQALQNFSLTRGILPAVALGDFGGVFGLKRHDLIPDHGTHAIPQGTGVSTQSKVHFHSTLFSALPDGSPTRPVLAITSP